jgi:hypothetical protein
MKETGRFSYKSYKFKPKLDFQTEIKSHPNWPNRCYIELPTGYVFIGEGAEVRVRVNWLNKETVGMASWIGGPVDVKNKGGLVGRKRGGCPEKKAGT